MANQSGDAKEANLSPEVAELLGEHKAHIEGGRPGADRPSTVREALEVILREQHDDLSNKQVKSAVANATPLLEGLYRILEDERKLTPEEKSRLVETASAFVAVFAQYERELAKAAQGAAPEPAMPTLSDVEATERLRDYLRGEVERVRTELFGSPRIPFKTVAEAATWLREESTQHAVSLDDALGVDEALRSYREFTSHLRIIAEPRIVFLGDPMLETLGEGVDDFRHCRRPSLMAAQLADMPGRVALHPAGLSSLLARLADVQERLARQVGIYEWEVTRLILFGAPPAVRRWRVRDAPLDLVIGGPTTTPWFTIEVHDSRLSYGDARRLVSDLAHAGWVLRTPSSYGTRTKQRHLLEFVRERRELRAPPMAHVDILAEWNDANPNDRYELLTAYHNALREARRALGEPNPPRVRGRRKPKT